MEHTREILPTDAEWPTVLNTLGEDMPASLWVCGTGNLRELTETAVAIVGSRVSTTYGDSVAQDIAAHVARKGCTVVSGGAFGIDAAAHRGALTTDTPTVVVLACGVDRAYPSAHTGLFQTVVARGGLIVSENPLGASPTRDRFLARNRIVVGLSLGTVLVESGSRSGSMNTARWTEKFDRELMAVPGPVTSLTSEGTHMLLKAGASLVTNGDDVMDVITGIPD